MQPMEWKYWHNNELKQIPDGSHWPNSLVALMRLRQVNFKPMARLCACMRYDGTVSCCMAWILGVVANIPCPNVCVSFHWHRPWCGLYLKKFSLLFDDCWFHYASNSTARQKFHFCYIESLQPMEWKIDILLKQIPDGSHWPSSLVALMRMRPVNFKPMARLCACVHALWRHSELLNGVDTGRSNKHPMS